ncbi:copper radical oxidase [Obba rivulosa]|uniref:Copper radical oxidase n=1 Tax=Obba rivulosa TaxID=1052685 RepID=A0A8E2AQ98_9APHY|nr:copper radical oxidase [Obba rivulosa]
MAVHAFLVLWMLAVLCSSACASKSAWNGMITPGSVKATTFTPYYVPPGAKSYDSASPLLHYQGHWTDSFSSGYVQKTLRTTSDSQAAMTFTFTGTGIEWFGNTDSRHGIAEVYMDGSMVQEVNLYSSKSMKQQRLFWSFDLPQGRHTVKFVNTGKKDESSKGTRMDVDALVVTLGGPLAVSPLNPLAQNLQPGSAQQLTEYPSLDLAASSGSASQWTLEQKGTTGVNAMQLAVISDTHAIIMDKVEHNPLTVAGHPAWGALYNLKTNAVKALHVQSNSFCAGGTFLSNGTMINVGGNPVVEDKTSAADFGDVDGLQAVRIFEPCDEDNVDSCDIYENHARIRMASPRWYNTVMRLQDGSAMIIGGSSKGGWINNSTTNNPTIEFWPPKNIHGSNGLPIHLPFLVDTLNSNLFPITFLLPDGTIFVAANQDAMIYNWQTNTERRLPRIPNGVRVTYPMTGTGLLLPLSPANNYTPEILLCGGSTVDDTQAGYDISSQAPASAQCSRMVLTDAGIAAGWAAEQMPAARTMPDAVLLPDGRVLLVNGAGSGISGYGNVRGQVGASNADNPVLTPVLYDPAAPRDARFSSAGLPSSAIPRMYHSVATLTPAGKIMIAGSNPNLDRSEVTYGTEYRVEWLSPPYMVAERPAVKSVERKIGFGEKVKMEVKLPSTAGPDADVQVVLMDLGFVTHAVHANSRMVYLETVRMPGGGGQTEALDVTGPPNANVYPPGPAWVYVVVSGVPSEGTKVMVGDGRGPPVDEGAWQNLLTQTSVDQYEQSKKGDKSDGSE